MSVSYTDGMMFIICSGSSPRACNRLTLLRLSHSNPHHHLNPPTCWASLLPYNSMARALVCSARVAHSDTCAVVKWCVDVYPDCICTGYRPTSRQEQRSFLCGKAGREKQNERNRGRQARPDLILVHRKLFHKRIALNLNSTRGDFWTIIHSVKDKEYCWAQMRIYNNALSRAPWTSQSYVHYYNPE